MPLHDYACRWCGRILRDVYRPVDQRATDVPPHCPNISCGADMEWIPAAPAVDLQFTPLTLQRKQPDGSYREETVSSVAQMRRIERESEVAARNGEGEQVRFRMWSQDRSNGDTNTFGSPDTPVLSAAAKAKFGRRGAMKPLAEAEANERALGPGVTDSNVSALVGG